MKRQRGQSLAEFAVTAGLFVVLLLGTEMIFRFHEVQRQAVIAAREASFTASWTTGRLAPEVLQQRVRHWHFEQPGWVDPTGNEAVPSREDAVTLRLAERAPPGTAAAAVDMALQPLRAVGGFLSSGFDLPMDRFAQAVVGVTLEPLARLPAPFDSLRLDLSEQLGVLGDSWMASGPTGVASRTAGLVPTGLLRTQGSWLRPALAPLGLVEPAISRLCFGLIEPDYVPLDRLGAGGTSAQQPGEPGCH